MRTGADRKLDFRLSQTARWLSDQPVKNGSVIIAGGGIGGLAAGLALHRCGFEVRVVERAPIISEVGAGLAVFSNACRAMAALGEAGKIDRFGTPFHRGIFGRPDGKVLGGIDLRKWGSGFMPSRIVRRADLQRVLLNAIPPGIVETGAETTGVDFETARPTVHLADGRRLSADLVVGADGFRSVVRKALWGETPVRYSGQTCFRAIANFSARETGWLGEIQGKGIRFGPCPIDAMRTYWWAAMNAPQGDRDDPIKRRDLLMARSAGWGFEIPEMIAAASPDSILRDDLVDRPPLPRWSRGAVTLLGDAAHPMLPNLGQGACSAIEDGVVLARCLRNASTIPQALMAYETERIPRTTRLTSKSWQFGIMARWTNPLLIRLRELAFATTPDFVLRREFSWQVEYDAGEEPST